MIGSKQQGLKKEFHIILLFVNCDIIYCHCCINVMKVILNVDGGFKCKLYLWSQSWMSNTSLVDRHFSHKGERTQLETHNSRCLAPGRLLGYWGVNYHSVVDNETLEFLIILLMIICS